MTEHVIVTIDAGVMDIKFNRADKRNALTQAMYGAVADAFGVAAQDPAIRCVVLCAAGDHFCAGNDISDFAGRPAVASNMESQTTRFLRAISTAPKPIVAAVQGNAVGVGTTMLLHCDLVVAATTVRLALPFANLGLVPEAASSLLLPRLVGWQRAAEAFMLGDVIDAPTAFSWGMVNRVVEAADMLASAHALAQRLAAKSPSALRHTKALMRGAPEDIAERMTVEGAIFGAQLQSPEAKEAFAAFFEKRMPDFSKFG